MDPSPPLLPPNSLLFRRNFFRFPSELASVFGVPGRLLYGDVPREGASSAGGGSRGSNGVAGSTGCMVGFERETPRACFGGAGGGYSGVRCVADDMRFLTLVNRPLDSEAGTGLFAGLLSCASDDDPTENNPDSRWLDFFLSPSIVGALVHTMCVKGRIVVRYPLNQVNLCSG